LFGRIHRAQSVTLLYIAFRIGVVEQFCQMVYYSTFLHYKIILYYKIKDYCTTK